jgi:hypothetical protein
LTIPLTIGDWKSGIPIGDFRAEIDGQIANEQKANDYRQSQIAIPNPQSPIVNLNLQSAIGNRQ